MRVFCCFYYKYFFAFLSSRLLSLPHLFVPSFYLPARPHSHSQQRRLRLCAPRSLSHSLFWHSTSPGGRLLLYLPPPPTSPLTSTIATPSLWHPQLPVCQFQTSSSPPSSSTSPSSSPTASPQTAGKATTTTKASVAAAAAAFSGMMGGEGSGKRVGVERRAGSGSLGVVAFDVEGLAASLYVCVCMGVCGPFLPSVCVHLYVRCCM